jgi:hypothetical protein
MLLWNQAGADLIRAAEALIQSNFAASIRRLSRTSKSHRTPDGLPSSAGHRMYLYYASINKLQATGERQHE